MLLAIDIGNSNIVIGGIDGDDIRFEARIATDRIKTSDQYGVEIKNMLDLFSVSVEEVEDCIISSVVPPVFNAVCTGVIKLTGLNPMVVGPGIKTGLNIQMDDPASVGSDRIVIAVAALLEYAPPLLLVDLGTATTIEVVDQGNTYLGGAIMPGVRVSAEALSSRAAQLPGIQLDRPRRLIGKNTVECMRSGIMYGAAAMLDGMIERMEEELGKSTTVVATGVKSVDSGNYDSYFIKFDGSLWVVGDGQRDSGARATRWPITTPCPTPRRSTATTRSRWTPTSAPSPPGPPMWST